MIIFLFEEIRCSHHPLFLYITQSHSRRDTRPADRGPPPVRNKRFEQLADEERERNRDRERDSTRAGPPPVAHSRFAAAAEADRSHRDNDRRDSDRGPPPVQNSRFAAAAAEAEHNRAPLRDDRGPPPVTNSRFAAAARMAEEEAVEREERRRERDSFYGQDGDDNRMRDDRRQGGGPPQPQNSRFAAAVAADSDYVDREERMVSRERERDERGDGGRFGDDRGSNRYDGYGRSGGSGRDELPRGPRGSDNFDSRPPSHPPQQSRVDQLLKPKAPLPTDNILKVPTKPVALEHESNMFEVPEKTLSKEHEDNMLVMPKKKKEEEPAPAEPETAKKEPEEEKEPLPTVNSDDLLAEFISGNKMGDDLKQWVEENRVGLPPVEKLVYELLQEREKLNPDIECAWAEPSNFGSAILSLVEDDILGQMQVLWGVQLYCDKIGFPKLNGESVVQSMFRAMYKHDLAEADAFLEWKEDESDEHEKGKLTTVIQTVDWFNWLEEDDDEEEEDYEEYEE